MNMEFISARMKKASKQTLWLASVAALLLIAACGGDHSPTLSGQYPPGSVSREDVERQLKFDARVKDFEVEDDKLIVNVNNDWVASPPGMQQRSLGTWYEMWQASRASDNASQPKGGQVIARYDGEDVARWSGERGYQPVAKSRSKEKEDGASSEN